MKLAYVLSLCALVTGSAIFPVNTGEIANTVKNMTNVTAKDATVMSLKGFWNGLTPEQQKEKAVLKAFVEAAQALAGSKDKTVFGPILVDLQKPLATTTPTATTTATATEPTKPMVIVEQPTTTPQDPQAPKTWTKTKTAVKWVVGGTVLASALGTGFYFLGKWLTKKAPNAGWL